MAKSADQTPDNRVVLRGFGRINAAYGITAGKELKDWP
jgi:hypothetical protein